MTSGVVLGSSQTCEIGDLGRFWGSDSLHTSRRPPQVSQTVPTPSYAVRRHHSRVCWRSGMFLSLISVKKSMWRVCMEGFRSQSWHFDGLWRYFGNIGIFWDILRYFGILWAYGESRVSAAFTRLLLEVPGAAWQARGRNRMLCAVLSDNSWHSEYTKCQELSSMALLVCGFVVFGDFGWF